MYSSRAERLIWASLVIIVLVGGWLMGRALKPEDREAASRAAAFRGWFWERRTLDLLAQVGLIFAGALGVAALLPGYQEMREIGARKEDHDPLA